MRGHAVLAVLSLLAVALSGCTDEDPVLKELEYEPIDTDGDASGNQTADDGNETAAPNAAPTANVTASPGNGTAPLNVTFTLDGGDADGDELAWTFTVGNATANGTSLPATVNATLEAGNWTATLTVSDGANQTVATAVVVVEAGEAGEEEPSGPFAVLTTSWAVGATDGPAIPDNLLCSASPHDGVTHTMVALPPGAGGRTFTATLTAATGIESVVEWGLTLFSAAACDGAEDAFFGEAPAPVGTGVTGTVTGTVPASADTMFAYSTGGAMLELTLTIE